MNQVLIDFGVGVLAGGLGLSACWGLFWLTIGTAGLVRGTCGWRVVLNSLTVGAVPLLCIAALLGWQGGAYGAGSAFGMGMMGMPIVLLGFGLRRSPDGRRAGMHMLDGVRRLMDELLGKHHECVGCRHEHDQGGQV